MYVGSHYTFREVLHWTRREAAVFLFLGALPPLCQWMGWRAPYLPWAPLAVLGRPSRS